MVHCKIEYNSSTHNLNVSFTGNITNGKPSKSYISYNVDLRDYLPEKVIVGFSAATGYLFEMNKLKSWSFNSSLKFHDENPTPSPIPTVKISPKLDSRRGTTSMGRARSWCSYSIKFPYFRRGLYVNLEKD
ncbi:L-type lectin-domain containing receptor kinase IX.1 [Trifolium repens]|jgi:hypothetical protein|nr:L-type lectin-domain containing receptor kinase IX.1 [Trifolium repens]